MGASNAFLDHGRAFPPLDYVSSIEVVVNASTSATGGSTHASRPMTRGLLLVFALLATLAAVAPGARASGLGGRPTAAATRRAHRPRAGVCRRERRLRSKRRRTVSGRRRRLSCCCRSHVRKPKATAPSGVQPAPDPSPAIAFPPSTSSALAPSAPIAVAPVDEKHEEASEKTKEEPKEEPNGEELFISPSGSDSNACTGAKPCQTMNRAYELAKAGATVRLLSGSYPEQHLEGDGSKTSSSHVVFAPASGASVKFTGPIDVLASHLTIEDMAVQDVNIGNFEADEKKPNPTDITLLNLTGRNFEIASATHITVEGGSWGPATACAEAYTGTYEGDNNAIRQPTEQAPEDILINETIIHNVQSDNFNECHIEGLAIFAGNHVTVSNSKFYENSVYDIFMQQNVGAAPDNITLEDNWFATAVDTTGKNGEPVGHGDGIAVGNELSENVTLEDNHFNDILNMEDAGEESTFHNVRVVGNVGILPYENYPCPSSIEWSKNVWQNDKCGATDVDLDGAALPYVNTANNSTLDYELTGKYAGWPEARLPTPAGGKP
jgi:hypothetical protein